MKGKLILDFGNVIAFPETGNYDITSMFSRLIDIENMDLNEFNQIRKKHENILSSKVLSIEEEYYMFYRFYYNILRDLNYSRYRELSLIIAYDRTYNLNKYILYNGVKDELLYLKSRYTLIMLSDNWPSVIPYLKYKNIYNLFDGIYISSIYGVEKKDKVFFDYPINDFNIKENEAIFIDDNEKNLDIASDKKLDVRLMDREDKIKHSKYKILKNLYKI